MVRLPTISLLTISVLIITTVLGCGVMPPGQASTRSFTVTNFKFAVSMVAYTGMKSNIPAEAPGVARSKEIATAFVERLVMQTAFDVLEQQSRSALLPDTIISSILAQLQIQINYDPLECRGATVIKNLQTPIMGEVNVVPHCIIVGNTVTALCAKMQQNNMVNCMMLAAPRMIETTNVIMANWSREMWQNVVNRAVRMLTAGPFASHFSSALATVN
ncbi:hypothetical protein KIN20_030656 [Parelaphostrongylus tenuis]|uniref:Uncharacterized protein n=1 Tax=Parelaphostrongylus tenuis TaxID=148309 RepID=A0AAD5R4E6_PARTN|nr:hypothetical protein KIN20_030656 [Parelaphostrongylus tenuis]